MAAVAQLRGLVGVLAKDLPHYVRELWLPGGDYLAIHNRAERLQAAPAGEGYQCQWQWTSELHAPRYFPSLGRALMRRALARHPIRRQSTRPAAGEQPEVSFVIGHRGIERLPNLLSTLETLAAQQGATIECVVVEQDVEPRIRTALPSWVRYLHTPLPRANLPYCRSWAFNAGAAQALGRMLVLHDNDLMVPIDYAARILEVAHEGYDVVNAKRFIFYLGEAHTAALRGPNTPLDAMPPMSIMQNAEGGGSIAIARDAFDAIGGMDESFVGWGGEDNEFWERAQTLRAWNFGSLPLVHLWHRPQPNKEVQDSDTMRLYRARSALPVAERIARLRLPGSRALSGRG